MLRTFCMHLVRSILFAHFPCTPSAFNPLHMCLVLLILFACFLCMLSVFNSFYKCLVLCLLCMCNHLSLISQHLFSQSSSHMPSLLFFLLAFNPLSHLYALSHEFLFPKHLVFSLLFDPFMSSLPQVLIL